LQEENVSANWLKLILRQLDLNADLRNNRV